VGVAPIYKFHVKDGGSEMYFRDNGIASEILINCEAGGNASLYFGDTADTVRGGITYSVADDSLQLKGYNNVERMRIDSAGNVGISVTPSAWGAGTKALEFANGSVISFAGSIGTVGTANSYYNGTNFIYKTTAAAARYDQDAGVHKWFNAPSGTAGNTVTFAQAMTLDASGRLIMLASTTTPATLTVNGQLTFTATSDTNLRFSYRGSDGTTRVANITLA
jgi:hypothetical protein